MSRHSLKSIQTHELAMSLEAVLGEALNKHGKLIDYLKMNKLRNDNFGNDVSGFEASHYT